MPELVSIPNAERALLQVKSALDEEGVEVFLRQGTCLGAVRDGVIIPWDDDVDIGSLIGRPGVTRGAIEACASRLRDQGFCVKIEEIDSDIFIEISHESTRIDWFCYKPVRGYISHHPGVRIPVRMLEHLTTCDFLGARFRVPNPPEEYLALKYGPDWHIPKNEGFEQDVIACLPNPAEASLFARCAKALGKRLGRKTAIVVLDPQGTPVPGAVVEIAGIDRAVTRHDGRAELYLNRETFCAVTIEFAGSKELLFQERLESRSQYTYQRDKSALSGRIFALEKNVQ